MKILVLASKHVRELLTYTECADVMREALAGLARGQIQQPLRTVVRPRDAAWLHGPDAVLLPGGGLRAEGAGHHAGQPGHRQGRAPGRRAAVRRAHREPLALINASAITEVRPPPSPRWRRTCWLRPDARPNWPSSAPACRAGRTRTPSRLGRTLTGIRLAGRDPARTREVAAELTGQLGQPVTAYDQVPAAVDGADIVVTATSSSVPGAAPRMAGPGRARERGRRLRAGGQGARHRDHGRGGRLRGQPRVGQPRG